MKDERKPIQVDKDTNEIIRLEAVRQSMKPNCVISMGDVIRQLAQRLNKKHKLIRQKAFMKGDKDVNVNLG